MAYRIGIDAGSKTIKVVIVDEDGSIVRSTYRRHRANIVLTLKEVLHDLIWRYGDVSGRVAVTGSAGIELSSMLGLPFVQEVVATTHAVRADLPQADAIIELGGEDAKIVYLSGGLEQRMNATCAGGTGGFIDTIAFMLGVSTKDMSSLAMSANQLYPIASRCAVFAQTDVRPLLNAGARKADIAASTLDAVVRQTLGGLACGRPIKGTVVFLGGPLEYIGDLTNRFRKALGLDRATGIKPSDAHLFTAKGAALLASGAGESGGTNPLSSLSRIEASLEDAHMPSDDLGRLPPLFEDAKEYAEFTERHAQGNMARARLFDAKGALYLGIDAGSTTVKFALLDECDRLVYSDYQPVSGDTLKTSLAMLEDLYASLPREYNGDPYVHIAHATVTGYGEDLLIAGLKADSGVVETIAHLKAAQLVEPKATFLLDIGGQDMKALWIKDGIIENAVLNEACSSGCGSFIEGTAHSLRQSPHAFSKLALEAENPVDLGTKCTVFMTSRVKHAQKIGVLYADISAGIAYSVIQNALFRIIGMKNLDDMGDAIVVQGGAFLSDAVLRAFELISGKHVIRPDTAHLMGAIGAARMAKARSAKGSSTLISREQAAALSPKRKAARCPGCENSCMLTIVEFMEAEPPKAMRTAAGPNEEGANIHLSGNRCERALAFFGGDARSQTSAKVRTPNLVALEQKLLAAIGSRTDGREALEEARPRIGILPALNLYSTLPFWHALFTELGFDVALPDLSGKAKPHAKGLETIPSESVCYPAKLAHSRLFELIDQGVDAVFMPVFERGRRCPVSSLYPQALEDSLTLFAPEGVTLHSPTLRSLEPEAMIGRAEDMDALLASLQAMDSGIPLSSVHLEQAALAAIKQHQRFQETLEQAADKAFAWMEEGSRRGIILAGRPYHVDPAVSHGIDRMLADMGFAVFTQASLRKRLAEWKETSPMPTGPAYSWKPGKSLAALPWFASQTEGLDIVYLQSFGCSFDALSTEQAEDASRAAGKLFTRLKIDEISDRAHIRIRLRTLGETLYDSTLRTCRTDDTAESADASSTRHDNPGWETPPMPEDVGGQAASRIPWTTLEAEDLDTARRCVNGDICSTASALAGRMIRMSAQFPGSAATVPDVCIDCLTGALPDLVRRATGTEPRLELGREWPENLLPPLLAEPDGTAADVNREGVRQPLVGLIGNPLLCFDPLLNDDIAQFIESQGCQPVFPDAASLFVDDVRYLEQLAAFEKQGVHHIIYLQSFGCLKGHVESRGALRGLGERFPGLTITVIDYDNEASALNRENRVRLALEMAKQSHAKGNAHAPGGE